MKKQKKKVYRKKRKPLLTFTPMNSTTLSKERMVYSLSITSQGSHLTPHCLNHQLYKPTSTRNGSFLSLGTRLSSPFTSYPS